jgi:short-subunit dehydrogenase
MASPTALITGASSGIGSALARRFATDGYDVVLVARHGVALDALAVEISRAHGVKTRVIAADLAEPGAGRRLFDDLERAEVVIDVVVNSAGFGIRGRVVDLPLDRQLQMIQVNVTALTELTCLFLPGMLQRNRGGVLNVGSTAAFQPGPLMAAYYATKAYVVSFTVALAEEVSGSKVRVSCLAPGPTATHFAETADLTGSRLFRLATPMPAEEVARVGYEGWMRGRVIVVPGATNRFGVFMVRFGPRAFVRKMTKRLNT